MVKINSDALAATVPVAPLSLPAMGLPALRMPDKSGFFLVSFLCSVAPCPGRCVFAGQPASGGGKVNRPRKRWPH
ncbi:hypothetical protein M9289_004625 [Salmonella enterica]|nr:hypothetical protein [Salmonella enterica]